MPSSNRGSVSAPGFSKRCLAKLGGKCQEKHLTSLTYIEKTEPKMNKDRKVKRSSYESSTCLAFNTMVELNASEVQLLMIILDIEAMYVFKGGVISRSSR